MSSIQYLTTLVRTLNEHAQAEELGVTVYLAGGAVRDTLLGRPVKDLDFFVEVDDDTRSSLTVRECLEVTFDVAVRDMWAEMSEDTEETWTAELREVYELGLENYFKGAAGEDILVVENFLAHFAKFPDSLSKVYIGPTGLVQSQAHLDTLADKVIWIRPGYPDRERRLADKYGPGNQYGEPFLELKVEGPQITGASL